MKKTLIVFTGIIITISACHKNAMPTITSRAREPLAPPTPVANVTPDIERGKTIFMNRCSRCHALPDPAQYTVVRWDGILKTMIPRARLDNEQGVHVSAYLKTNASDKRN